MVWYAEFGSVFWITVGTLLTGSIALCIKYSLKSKCRNISICYGCLEIDRAVELEQNEIIEMTENANNII
jgi:hypothetical protein